MIQRVRTVGFKGFDIDEPVPDKVIYYGKNKSGKSSRAGAIAIALYGHIPFSTAGKKPGDILDSFGKDTLIAAVTIDGKEFGRKFSRNPKGGVSQTMQVDKKRVASENFAILLNKAGAPKIADIAEFMKQSEAKKVDTLFELYPNPELAYIDTEIEEAKEDVSKWTKKKDGAESTIQRLTDSKTSIQLPSGSIAEVQDSIKKHEIEIVDLEKQIKDSELSQAKIEGEKKGKEVAENQALEKIKNAKQQTNENQQGVANNNSGGHAFVDSGYPEVEARFGSMNNGDETPPNIVSKGATQSNMAKQTYMTASILRIIEALESVGCNTCAALIVAKQELKKYKGQQ